MLLVIIFTEVTMSKINFKLIFLILVICFFVAIIVLASIFVYATMFEKEMVCSYNSENNEYTVNFYQVGASPWLFSPAHAMLELKNSNGKRLDKIKLSLNNDGGIADRFNIKDIKWEADSVLVLVRGYEEQAYVACRLFYGEATDKSYYEEQKKEEIFKLVNDNIDTIRACIEAKNYDKLKEFEGIEYIATNSAYGYITFECGGFGYSKGKENYSKLYFGFYYAPSHLGKNRYEGNPSGNGYYKEASTLSYYTEEICDNFYFFIRGHSYN